MKISFFKIIFALVFFLSPFVVSAQSTAPDLIAGTLHPDTAVIGTATTFTATIINDGTAGTGGSFSNVFQTSLDGNRAQTSYLAIPDMSPLAANGGHSDASVSITFPAGTPSTIYLRACADATSVVVLDPLYNGGVISESNESDNCSNWMPVTVSNPTGSAQSDLRASDPLPDQTPVFGTPVNFTSTITNYGTAGTGVSFPNIFQTSSSYNGTGPTNYPIDYVYPLNAYGTAGDHAVISQSLTFNLVGTTYVRACANATSTEYPNVITGGASISDSNLDNNCSHWMAVTVTDPSGTTQLSDLVASPISFPDTGTKYINVLQTIVSTISNINPNYIHGDLVTNLFQYDEDTDHSTGVTSQINSFYANGLGTAQITDLYNFTTPGIKYVRVCTDTTNTIPESNENNNCSVWTAVTVTDPSGTSPYTVFYTKTGAGASVSSISSLPENINCATGSAGDNCTSPTWISATLTSPTTTFTASPGSGYQTSWSGCGATTTGNTCTVSARSNITVTFTAVSGTTAVNGGWSTPSCPTVCGQSASTLTRSCNNPFPANGGATCSGSATQNCSATAACGTGTCSDGIKNGDETGIDTGGRCATGTGSAYNISGWAWSSNIGWISMSCDNDSSCTTVDYGVNEDPTTGYLTGYAWSSNIGWIQFGTPARAPALSGWPATTTANGTTNSNAKVDLTTGAMSGWAQAISNGGGWTGWISLSGKTAAGTRYGVTLTSTGSTSPSQYDCKTDCVWGSDVVGWVDWSGVTVTTSVVPYTVSLTKAGPGASLSSIDSVPPGLTCALGATCTSASPASATFTPPATVTLTAHPGSGYQTGWTNCGATTSGPTCTVSGAATIIATFTATGGVPGGWSVASCPTACGQAASTITRTCTNPTPNPLPANGGVGCTGTAIVSCPTIPACSVSVPDPVVTLSATKPGRITKIVDKSSTTLTWSVIADSSTTCTASSSSNNWLGQKVWSTADRSEPVNGLVAGTYTYTLTCEDNFGQTGFDTATVRVEEDGQCTSPQLHYNCIYPQGSTGGKGTGTNRNTYPSNVTWICRASDYGNVGAGVISNSPRCSEQSGPGFSNQ